MMPSFFQGNHDVDSLRLLYIEPNLIAFCKVLSLCSVSGGPSAGSICMAPVLSLLLGSYICENEQQVRRESSADMD